MPASSRLRTTARLRDTDLSFRPAAFPSRCGLGASFCHRTRTRNLEANRILSLGGDQQLVEAEHEVFLLMNHRAYITESLEQGFRLRGGVRDNAHLFGARINQHD